MSQTLDFGPSLQVLIGDDGIAEVVFGPAGAMPTTDAQGHADVAVLWSKLARLPGLRVILVRSVGKGFSAGGKPELVQELLDSESARLRTCARRATWCRA